MKTEARIIRTLLAALVLGICLALAAGGSDTQAATVVAKTKKTKLVKKGSNYYYYKNGKKVKSSWATIKVSGVKYKYYFGKNGAAYRGTTRRIEYDGGSFKVTSPALKKIKKKQYAFDEKGHMLKGTQVILIDEVPQFYVFNKTGTVNKTKTKALRKLADGLYEKDYSSLEKQLAKAGSSAVKDITTDGCYRSDGKDHILNFGNFALSIFVSDAAERLYLGLL